MGPAWPTNKKGCSCEHPLSLFSLAYWLSKSSYFFFFFFAAFFFAAMVYPPFVD